jgi:hypothetical protein
LLNFDAQSDNFVAFQYPASSQLACPGADLPGSVLRIARICAVGTSDCSNSNYFKVVVQSRNSLATQRSAAGNECAFVHFIAAESTCSTWRRRPQISFVCLWPAIESAWPGRRRGSRTAFVQCPATIVIRHGVAAVLSSYDLSALITSQFMLRFCVVVRLEHSKGKRDRWSGDPFSGPPQVSK